MAALERVEVIKGPQGTLFGKNTMGGAINMVTRKPSGELEGEIGGSFGTEDLLRGKILLDLPAVGEIGEGVGQLSTLAALTYSENESTIDNSLGGNYGAREQTGAMLRLLLDVTDSFSIDYIYDHSDTDFSTSARQLVSAIPASLGFFLLGQDNPKRQSSFPSNSFADDNNSEVTGHALTVTWDINEALTLKSITANRESKVHEIGDTDGSGTNVFQNNTLLGKVEALTQELQLVGVGDNYQFVAGLYYFDEEGADRFTSTIRGGAFPVSAVDTQNEAIAAFGQATWNVSQTWSVTGGLRYTEEERDMTTSAVPGVPVSESFDNLSPMFAIAWAPGEDHNLYLKYSEGWRSGGFNGRARSAAALIPFDEETVASYELGIKSYFMNRMVRLNAAVFYNEYEDRQTATSQLQPDGSIASVTDNAGESEMTGVEIELTALATPNLELTANYGYLDTEYTKYLDLDADGNVIDVKDENVFTYSPEHSAHFAAKYTFAGFSWGVPSVRIDYSWKDEYHTERLLRSADIATQKSHGLLSARIDVVEIPLGNGSFRAALWGKNLTDEDVKLFSIDLRSQLGWGVAHWNDHATYGLDLSYAF
ncbi:MAG: TonB-dependent receptor [Halioglobus sp.]|nr:TonB-dependent receptor [Halioglobus sp.]